MYMYKIAEKYPDYGFEKHVGYGTKQHIEAIEKYGVLPVHRKSFAPIKKFISSSGCLGPDSHSSPRNFFASKKHSSVDPLQRVTQTAQSGSMNFSPTDIGNNAEDIAEEFLISKGHEILARNWKTKYCEADIISTKGRTLYFTEVKYRKNTRAGGGIDAITKKKENQMRYAAKFYLESNELDGKINAVISAISLTGNPPVIETYIKNIK